MPLINICPTIYSLGKSPLLPGVSDVELLDAHFQPGIHSIHPKLPLSYVLGYYFRCHSIADAR
jgi:hypothetical protein